MLRHACRKGGATTLPQIAQTSAKLHSASSTQKVTASTLSQVRRYSKSKNIICVNIPRQFVSPTQFFHRSLSISPEYVLHEHEEDEHTHFITNPLSPSYEPREINNQSSLVRINNTTSVDEETKKDDRKQLKAQASFDSSSSDTATCNSSHEIDNSKTNDKETMTANTIKKKRQKKHRNINANKSIEDNLTHAIRTRNVSYAMKLFHDIPQNRTHKIPIDHWVDLLALTCRKGKLDASHLVLQRAVDEIKKQSKQQIDLKEQNDDSIDQDHTSTIKTDTLQKPSSHPIPVSIYIEYCKNIEKSKYSDAHDVHPIIHYFFKHIKSLEQETYQEAILPLLFISILKQSNTLVKYYCHNIWEYMSAKRITCPPSILEEMLHFSYLKAGYYKMFNKQRKELPFDRVLKQLVQDGHYPSSQVVVETLVNDYPFKKSFKTTRILDSIQKLYQMKQSKAKDQTTGNVNSPHEYQINYGTLELITTSASKPGDTDLILLVWDVMDTMGYRPNETMYENAIHAFIKAYKQDHRAFAAMAEMEANGYVPSRALTQQIAQSISYSNARTDNAYYILTNGTEGTEITCASLNCVLASYAKLGHVEHAFSTYDEFEMNGIEPNADTFSYLMEALATEMINPSPFLTKEPETQIEEAEAIFNMMAKLEMQPSEYYVHHYVCFLIHFKELEKAKTFLQDMAENRKVKIQLPTFENLAHQFIQSNDVDSANEICDLMRSVANEHNATGQMHRDIVPIQLKKQIETAKRNAKRTISKDAEVEILD